MRPAPILAWVLTLAVTSACDRSATFERPLDPSAGYALAHHAAWLLRGQHALATLQPATMVQSRLALPAEPVQAFVSPAGDGLLIIDDGPGAQWVRFEANRVELGPRFALTGTYGEAWFAPEGDRVVLSLGAGGALSAPIANPNQIALLDLDRGTHVERTLRSFGDRPRAIVVGPRASVAGAERQLVWALADRYMAVFDLLAPEAREVVVHLTLATDTRTVQPRQVVVGEVDGAYTAFVRADAADDIFALSFPEASPADEVPKPYLNQLPGGQRPSDEVAVALAEGTRVFAVEPSLPGLSIIDPVTGARLAVSAELPVQHILAFEAPRPDDEAAIGHFALLWRTGSAGVVFADLDRIEERRGRALTPLVLGGAIAALDPLPGRRMALARTSNQQLTVLDFDARTATPLDLSADLLDVLIDPTGARIYLRLADAAVISLDADTLTATSTEVLVGYESRLLLVPEAGRLVLSEPGDTIDVAVLPVTDLDEATPIVRHGLLLEGVLDR
ncbi:MAG: hypothetical protein KC620_07565 [Myxococcales bacterium]|nr:hypothetical protein [Myxococcales bacterium]